MNGESVVFGHLWATDETRELFSDAGRTRAWIGIIATLAAVQGELGIIPAQAAEELATMDDVDLDAVGEQTRATGHSTLGLIRVLRRDLGPEAADWIYYGATVQDVTDTWFGLVMQRILTIARRELEAIETALTAHAEAHRGTLMLGRTHGQPGLPITFGFKAAQWAAEIRRHRTRIDEAEPRLVVGQLAGAVGTLSAFGDQGLELRALFLERLGLNVPDTSWLTARDRIAEYASLLALITGTLAKLGNEVYNLQRPELGELSEAPTEGVVGSITMPQKRNPERSEHLWTLARVVRAGAGLALEGLVGEHERDGASWKTEWQLLPQASAAAATALQYARELVEGLQVNVERMRANLDAQRGYVLAEAAMLELSEQLGKQRAHELVHQATLDGQQRGITLQEALTDLLPGFELDPYRALGSADAMT